MDLICLLEVEKKGVGQRITFLFSLSSNKQPKKNLFQREGTMQNSKIREFNSQKKNSLKIKFK